MYVVLMMLLALSFFLLIDFTYVGIMRRIKEYRWSIMVLFIGIVTSLFVDNALSAGWLILVSSFIALFLRVRKCTDWG